MAVGYAQVVLADSPASYWRLGDLIAGSSAADAGSGAVIGTYSGQLSRGMPGAVQGDNDSCVAFLNGYVDMGNHYAYTGTSAFSCEAWIQLQKLPPSGFVACIAGYFFASGGNQGWRFSVGAAGNIYFERYLNSVADQVTTANNYMPLGQWTHVVATYDGTNMKLYVNGSLIGTTASSRSIAAGTGTSFQIAHDDPGDQFVGMIDEVAIYNAALTSTQVANHYNSANFLVNAPTYLAAISGGTQVAQSGQINQSLGLHTLTVHNTGTLQVGIAGASASPGTTWTLSGQWLDQPFTMPSNVDTIDRVEVALQKLGSGTDITVTLRPDSSGVPSATILATVKIPADFIPTGRARMVSLPLQATGLTMSGVYHLVFQSGGTSGNTLVAPQGGTGLGTMQTSTNGTSWTSHTGVSLIAGIYQGDAPPTRNIREASDCWAELENDASGHLVGVYEMVQGARTAHRFQYSGYGRLTKIV
jgi:hypothetical protein